MSDNDDTIHESSDSGFLALMRRNGPMSVAELGEATSVTATAVRQRLSRLMADGLVRRETDRSGRGRPSHRYSLSEKARQRVGSNFADLAIVLWEEIRRVNDPEVRQGLLARVASSLAERYADRVEGKNLVDRLRAAGDVFDERSVPFEVDDSRELPVLRALECPYPTLAERDRGICAVERLMMAELIESDVKLTQCRLDGHSCCEFAAAAPAAG
ncbi:MAG: MarR family transcriptional regulator [Pirellulales bacterium]